MCICHLYTLYTCLTHICIHVYRRPLVPRPERAGAPQRDHPLPPRSIGDQVTATRYVSIYAWCMMYTISYLTYVVYAYMCTV